MMKERERDREREREREQFSMLDKMTCEKSTKFRV